VQELRVAARRLVKDRWCTLLAAVALGLGIGVNTTFFALVNAAVLRGLPIVEPERVLFIGTRDAQDRPRGLSYQEFVDVGASATSFDMVAAYSTAPMTLGDEALAPARVLGTYISWRGFTVLGDQPRIGRHFTADDDRPGAEPVTIISDALWTTRYAQNAAIVGRSVVVNGVPATVIGVMAAGARFPTNTDVWVPLASFPGLQSQPRQARTLSVFGRLSAGASLTKATADVQATAAAWSRDFPDRYRGVRLQVEPINDRLVGRVTDVTWLAFITAGWLVLLIACANVANLLLMRATTRAHEIAVRRSLGATRWNIVRQLLVESALLGVLGALVGVSFSWLGLKALVAMIPPDTLAYWFRITIDARVLGVLLAATVGSVFVFGLSPALYLSRTDASTGLNEHARGASGGIRSRRWTLGFLTAEFALTLVLVANVVLDVRLANAATHAEYPFDSEHVLTMWVTLPNQPYDTAQARTTFFDAMEERLASIPSVSAAAVASALPHAGGLVQELAIAGRAVEQGAAPVVVTVAVGDSYFDAIDLPMRQGRGFRRGDGAPGQEVAVISQKFADMYFPGANPTDQVIRLTSPGLAGTGPWLRIVGVVPTVRQRGAVTNPDPVVYLPYTIAPPASTAVMLRASGDPGVISSLARERLRQIDPSLPLYRLMSMEDALNAAEWNGRVSDVLLGSIGIVAVLLALVGMYTVVTHAVAQRRRELGIRLALGARPREIGTLVLRRAMLQLIIGLGVGIACIVAFDKLFTSADGAFRLTDPLILGTTIAAMAAMTLVTCLIPSWRAARISPLDAIRVE
jgi:predicted permease